MRVRPNLRSRPLVFRRIHRLDRRFMALRRFETSRLIPVRVLCRKTLHDLTTEGTEIYEI